MAGVVFFAFLIQIDIIAIYAVKIGVLVDVPMTDSGGGQTGFGQTRA